MTRRLPPDDFVTPDDLDPSDDDSDDLDSSDQTKKPEPSSDPAVWLSSNRMTQTEVALRLARHLLAANLVASDVAVSLTGLELTRQDRPLFPVERFLAERGLTRVEPTDDWRGIYVLKQAAKFSLVLHSIADEGDVVATLRDENRLVVHVSRGRLESARGPAEHKLLWSAIGRAVTWEHSEPTDVVAAAVPRSKRFRQLAVRYRATYAVSRACLLILTVDRAGTVEGLPRISNGD